MEYVLKREQPVLLPRKRVYYSRGQAYTIEWQESGQPLPAWFDPLMQGLVDLLQAGEIDVKRFSHLTQVLKAEHRNDCNENGVPVPSEFRV